MPKTRMSALDVRACVNELKGTVLGAKLANVYDVSSKVYTLKLMKAGVQYNLVIESGVRIHLTKFLREKKQFPNTLSQKLRKHIRNRRIEAVRQIGFDRIVDLVFGNGETTYHVIIELYSGGNIILTDYKFEILALLRSYRLPDGTEVDVKRQYDFHPKQQDPFRDIQALTVSSLNESISLFTSRWNELKNKEKQVRNILASNNLLSLMGYLFIMKCLRLLNIGPTSTTENEGLFASEEKMEQLLTVIQSQASEVEKSILQPRGYILCEGETIPATETAPAYEPYVEFGPFSITCSEKESVKEFGSFNECIDVFFVNEENMKLAIKLKKSRDQITKKVANISAKQDSHMRAIREEIMLCKHRIHAMLSHPDVINTAIVVINQYLSQGVQWSYLQEQINLFKKRSYNLFHHVKELDLEHNRIKMEFQDDFDPSEDDSDYESEDESEEEENIEDESDEVESETLIKRHSHSKRPSSIVVDVELSCTCHQNITLLYTQKKELEDKLVKTQIAAEAALAEATKQQQKQLHVHETAHPAEIAQQRPKRWFEKYDWFVTSDAYLVLCGRSGEQNETLVRKYLRKGDLFMHADTPGAAATVIRNYRYPLPVSNQALQQAAVFALSHSSAWEAAQMAKVYWVTQAQISKTGPAGEVLPMGSFVIRGKKNYLAPYRLEMGLTVLFEVRSEDERNHRYERKPRGMEDGEWDDLIARGVVKVDETAAENDPEVFAEEEDYVIEKMDTVTNSKSKSPAKPVVQGRSEPKKESKKESKKSRKGTTKKSRAIAEEEAEMEALVAEQTKEVKKKEMSRGEKRKMKKMKKHAAMDDEEKKLMEVLYGHLTVDELLKGETPKSETVDETPNETPNEGGTLEKKKSLSEADRILQDLLGIAPNETPSETPMCYTCGSSDHSQKECPESWRVIEGIKDMPEEQPENGETGETGETGEIADPSEGKEAVEEGTVVRDASDFLLNWTPTPLAEDGILHAIPMCAPFMTMSENHYRVKLTPGKMKKGAMAKSVIEVWMKAARTEAEKKALTQLQMQDLITVIINNSKAILPSGKGKNSCCSSLMEKKNEEDNTNDDSPDSSWVSASSSTSESGEDSDDSSTVSIDTVLLNFIIDLIRNDAINRLRMTPDMLQKLDLIEKIASKYGIRRDSLVNDGTDEMDYLGRIADSEDLVDTIMERNYSFIHENAVSLSPVSEFGNISESVSFIEDDGETTPTRKAISLSLDESISPISQADSADLLLIRPHPGESPASDEVLSQASNSPSPTYSEDSIISNLVSNQQNIVRFMKFIGHEEVSPAVFDSNNRGVDYFLLPVYYTPQLCGFVPDSALKIVPNYVIADRYLILRKLGQATFSVTVECIDMRGQQNEHLCLKIIKKKDYFFDQSLDEIRVLRYLNNCPQSEDAHLLRLHDYFYNKQHLFIVTELLKDNLYEFNCISRNLPNPYFTLPRIRIIVKQILEALQFIHGHNVVHCDLKPENVLLFDIVNARIKLVDFGGANFIRSVREAGIHPYIQSRSYRAPEVILKMAFDERIDLWSLGCITAELFTGELLFDNSSTSNLLTSASAVLGPIPSYLLRVANLNVFQQGNRSFVKLEQGMWELDPPHKNLQDVLDTDDVDFIDFILQLLQWDPMERMTASQALQHPFITRERPCEPFEWNDE